MAFRGLCAKFRRWLGGSGLRGGGFFDGEARARGEKGAVLVARSGATVGVASTPSRSSSDAGKVRRRASSKNCSSTICVRRKATAANRSKGKVLSAVAPAFGGTRHGTECERAGPRAVHIAAVGTAGLQLGARTHLMLGEELPRRQRQRPLEFSHAHQCTLASRGDGSRHCCRRSCRHTLHLLTLCEARQL